MAFESRQEGEKEEGGERMMKSIREGLNGVARGRKKKGKDREGESRKGGYVLEPPSPFMLLPFIYTCEVSHSFPSISRPSQRPFA